MPKRLLKIEFVGNIVRVTKTAYVHKYALLSYCWGGDQESKTVLSNLKSHERGMANEALPRTIRDAIEVTRCLKLEHLWVGTLCKSRICKTRNS